jgi:hypothetical protein
VQPKSATAARLKSTSPQFFVPDIAAAAADAPHHNESLDAYVRADDLDALFAERQSRRARIVEPPTVREYHC